MKILLVVNKLERIDWAEKVAQDWHADVDTIYTDIDDVPSSKYQDDNGVYSGFLAQKILPLGMKYDIIVFVTKFDGHMGYCYTDYRPVLCYATDNEEVYDTVREEIAHAVCELQGKEDKVHSFGANFSGLKKYLGIGLIVLALVFGAAASVGSGYLLAQSSLTTYVFVSYE